MQSLIQDLRYAIRLLVRSPGYVAVAVLSLALGIGANTAIFSIFNALLLRPMPGKDPAQMVTVYTSDYSGPLYGASSYADFADFRERNEVFSGLAAYRLQLVLLTDGSGESFQALTELISAEYFDVLGLRPARGRFLRQEEESQVGRHSVVILSYGIWQRIFGGDPDIIGGTLNVNGKPLTVIGIAPANFAGMMRGVQTEVWIPVSAAPILGDAEVLTSRGNRGMFVFGRLKPEISFERAEANMALIGRQLHEQYLQNWINRLNEPRKVSLLPESKSRILSFVRGPVIAFLSLLMAGVGLVLLIACANLANLQLSRALSRRKEVAIRTALGAGRWRMIRQLLTESLLLSLLAGAAGVLLALWMTNLLNAYHPPLPVSIAFDLRIDYRVLLFTAAVSAFTGILFGLAPALRVSRPDVSLVLKDAAGATGGRKRSLLRNTLVAVQVCVSMLLLIGAGLFLRSLANAEALNPGFDASNVLLFDLDLEASGYNRERGLVLYRELQERLGAIPEVDSVSMATRLPLDLGWSRQGVEIEGYEFAEGEDTEVHFAQVGPDYFRTLRVPLVAGSAHFDERGVVVNEAFVRRYLPGRDPLGKRITSNWRVEKESQSKMMQITGVAADGKYNSLGEGPTPFVFFPLYETYTGQVTVLLRSGVTQAALTGRIRTLIQSMDPNLPLLHFRTLESQSGLAILPARVAAGLLGILGTLALILAAIGIYGVISYTVTQRTQEIGIRVALGAQRRDIIRMVIGQGLMITAAGGVAGIAAAAALTRFARFFLYGISPLDLPTFVIIPALLTTIAFLACWIPARRATRVDPVVALRYE